MSFKGFFYTYKRMNLGEFNLLTADEFTDHGLYLADTAGNRVLLPGKFIPEGIQVGEQLEVFIYNDSEDRPVATTQKPKLEIGKIAYLQVVGTSQYGAFLDWGLDKDLFIPFKNQREKMREGESFFVTVYVDDFSDRLVATERIGYMFQINADILPDTAYQAVVYEETPIGYKIYVEGPARGMVYKNELPKELSIGEEIQVYLKNIRPDGKCDFKTEKGDSESVRQISNQIMDYLEANEGKCTITDRSTPEEIAKTFEVSKKLFKKAVGMLYRERKILLNQGVITKK